MRKLIALLLAASALTGTAFEVEGKGPKPSRRGGGGLYLGPGIPHGHTAPANMLSRAELRWCVEKQEPIDAGSTAIAADEANLEARGRSVDHYSQRSIDAYNALVDAFNAKVRGHNVDVDDWNSRCANRSYYVSDMDAIRGGR